eukprot:gene8355-biopygen13660
MEGPRGTAAQPSGRRRSGNGNNGAEGAREKRRCLRPGSWDSGNRVRHRLVCPKRSSVVLNSGPEFCRWPRDNVHAFRSGWFPRKPGAASHPCDRSLITSLSSFRGRRRVRMPGHAAVLFGMCRLGGGLRWVKQVRSDYRYAERNKGYLVLTGRRRLRIDKMTCTISKANKMTSLVHARMGNILQALRWECITCIAMERCSRRWDVKAQQALSDASLPPRPLSPPPARFPKHVDRHLTAQREVAELTKMSVAQRLAPPLASRTAPRCPMSLRNAAARSPREAGGPPVTRVQTRVPKDTTKSMDGKMTRCAAQRKARAHGLRAKRCVEKAPCPGKCCNDPSCNTARGIVTCPTTWTFFCNDTTGIMFALDTTCPRKPAPP